MLRHIFTRIVLSCVLARFVISVDPIIVENGRFALNSTKSEFNVLGFRYRNTNSTDPSTDALSDPDACLRDAALFQSLGINTIHVSALSATANHDDCMSIFNSIGVYVSIGLEPYGTIWEYFTPLTSYTTEVLERMFQVVDAFKDYENTFAFNVVDSSPSRMAPDDDENGPGFTKLQPYIRALVRDVKQYIAANSPGRPDIPVGFRLAVDVRMQAMSARPNWWQLAYDYATCSIPDTPDDVSRADFMSIQYLNLAPRETETEADDFPNAAWLTNEFSSLFFPDIPVYFDGYRTFLNASVDDFAPKLALTDDFNITVDLADPLYNHFSSGGLILEWANVQVPETGPHLSGEPDLGIVGLDSSGNLQMRQAYSNLQQTLDKMNVQALRAGPQVTSSTTFPDCAPLATSTIADPDPFWTITYTFSELTSLPTPPPKVEELIRNGASGSRGQHVDVTGTMVKQTIRDVAGNIVRSVSISPSRSSPRPRRTGATPADDGASRLPPSSNASMRIGLGIGIPVIALGLGAAALLVFLRRRKQRQRIGSRSILDAGNQGETGNVFTKSELPTDGTLRAQIVGDGLTEKECVIPQVHEIDGKRSDSRTQCHEVDSGLPASHELAGASSRHSDRAELDATETPRELHGNSNRSVP